MSTKVKATSLGIAILRPLAERLRKGRSAQPVLSLDALRAQVGETSRPEMLRKKQR